MQYEDGPVGGGGGYSHRGDRGRAGKERGGCAGVLRMLRQGGTPPPVALLSELREPQLVQFGS